jgi:inner membrane protein
VCYKIFLEPITHFLTGACLGRTGFNRKTALATATMTLAAEAPDLDVLWGFKGPVYGFAHHRGFTHSFLGSVLISAIVTGFMYLVWRIRGRRTNIPNLPPRWGLLFALAYLACLSHILLDYTNNYGVRPFWPFWEKWYSWNVAFIFEPPMFLLLLAGLLLPALVLRSRPRSRALFARVALLCVVLLWVVRFYQGTKTVRRLTDQHYHSEAPLRASAFPYWSPDPAHLVAMHWSAVVETQNFYIVAPVHSSTGQLDPAETAVIAKPEPTPAILAAERSRLGRLYLDWAGYPLVSEDSDGADTVVFFRDLRFGYSRLARSSILEAHVTVDRNLNVIGEAMGDRQQKPPLD